MTELCSSTLKYTGNSAAINTPLETAWTLQNMSGQQPRSELLLFGGIEVDISQLNFNDHSSNVAAVKISCIIFIALVIPVVALRIYSRLKCGHRIFADDSMTTDPSTRLC